MWESALNGRKFHFFLTGINNQNFLMQDRETGSWWQQVSGKAIRGPLQGQQLKLVSYDEISFKTWKRESPNGRILKPKPNTKYAPANWEERISKLPVVIQTSDFHPRTLIVGLVWNGESKAYPFDEIVKQSPLIDQLADIPLVILAGEDSKSIRVFDRRIDNQVLEFYARPEIPLIWIDSQTGSEWDFTGTCIRGTLQGKQLKKLPSLKDFWFDWKNYHRDTRMYSAVRKKLT